MEHGPSVKTGWLMWTLALVGAAAWGACLLYDAAAPVLPRALLWAGVLPAILFVSWCLSRAVGYVIQGMSRDRRQR